MPNEGHRDCYGTMLPDPREVRRGGGTRGKAFSLLLAPPSGLYRKRPEVSEDAEEWEDCLCCEEFDTCYRLCMARAVMRGMTANL